ncbi:MAG: quinone-dependent dihydroorotate dehydrogenase, partial [Nitrososphaera sp.]|nr:quinone-dependent dihydroorotate dehydrogenase [Nitrososphaera sp.]
LALMTLRILGHAPLRSIIIDDILHLGLGKRVLGMYFSNPVGLAAGFDKNGVAIRGIETLGFGFTTVGTVVPRRQKGNPRPRIFRLEEDRAIINRLGFNSDGAPAVATRFKKYGKVGIPVFISIGKNKDTPDEKAVDDYVACIEELHPYADAFECNVSSPNTPGLRDLQQNRPLLHLCRTLQDTLERIAQETKTKKKPLLLKVAPDLTDEQFMDILAVIQQAGVDGLIVCNTTTKRPPSLISKHKDETGGLSAPDNFMVAYKFTNLAHRTLPDLPIITVSGITSAERAQKAMDVGASLVQLFAPMIYDGPLIAWKICRDLRKLRDRCYGYST